MFYIMLSFANATFKIEEMNPDSRGIVSFMWALVCIVYTGVISSTDNNDLKF